MKLKDVKKLFEDGRLTKPEYIDEMYEVHSVLFDFSGLIRNTDIQRIEITEDEVIMTTRTSGIKLIVAPCDRRIIPIEILNFGSYETDILDMMNKLIDEFSTIFDIGSNVGWYTINLFRSVKNVKIYSFEPIPQTFELLKRNLELNEIRDVKLLNHGLSNEGKDISFYYNSNCSGNASIANLNRYENTEKIICRVKRVDDIVKNQGITVDFMKVDVEGAEKFVFEGAIETLKKDKPIVFSEMLRKWSANFDYHPNDVLKLFNEIGYRCFSVSDGKLKEFSNMNEDTNDKNFFFLHHKKHALKIKSHLIK